MTNMGEINDVLSEFGRVSARIEKLLVASAATSAGDDGRAPLRRRVTVSLHEDGESVARWEPSLPAGVNEPDEQTEYVRAVGALMTAQKAYDASCPGPGVECAIADEEDNSEPADQEGGQA